MYTVYPKTLPEGDFLPMDPARLVTLGMLERNVIQPIHAAIYPTNACNYKCSFCACAQRNIREYLSIAEVAQLIAILGGLGTRAITLSGGGEPTLHGKIGEILSEIFQAGMQCGMITNGARLHRIDGRLLGKMSWVRISLSSETRFSELRETFDPVIRDTPEVHWGFKYVLCGDDNAQLSEIAAYAASSGVSLYITKDVFQSARSFELPSMEYSDSIFFNTKDQIITRGARRCFMGLFKPHILANGMVYPCCGCGTDIIYDPAFALGHYTELPRIVAEQREVDGSKCARCYYGSHNEALGKIRQPQMVQQLAGAESVCEDTWDRSKHI